MLVKHTKFGDMPSFSRVRSLLPILFSTGLFFHSINECHAQYDYLSTVNYSNLTINRVGNIPGVEWVISDNSTYDANHQRFFFQGNATNIPPFSLYTLNAVTASVLSNPICPAPGGTSGNISGLQYDNATDTLYGLYLSGGSAWFSSIDPATGMVNMISQLNNFSGYNWSAFDTRGHRYICVSGEQLWVIDAATGKVLSNPAFSPVAALTNPVFDNLTGHLYGVGTSPSWAYTQFDSVGLTNGILYRIADLPSMSLPQIYTMAIDEAAGKYIFVGSDQITGCISNFLYIVDINTGIVLSKRPYPYAQGTTIVTDDNLIEYSFDNIRGTLYALNWDPPQENMMIRITAADSPVCAGSPETFTAGIPPGLTSPVYQWQWNGNNVGTNSPSYTNNDLADGDSVRCILMINSACLSPFADTSNSIFLHVVTSPPAALTITASVDDVCAGDTIVFTATPVGGGNAPAYQWQIDGIDVGAGLPVFATNRLEPGDSVICQFTSTGICIQTVASTAIAPLIRPTPSITISTTDSVIPYGQEVQLQVQTDSTVTNYQWTPATGLNDPSIANPIATPLVSTLYQVTVLGADGCSAKDAVEIKVYRVLQMPDAFTPNGDGRNDVFRVPPLLQINVLHFSIYNRWGEQVFSSSSDAEGWDGRWNSRAQPAGAYVWKIEYEDLLTGRMAVASGTVMLVR
jgi:gliding motility-associated-like protein